VGVAAAAAALEAGATTTLLEAVEAVLEVEVEAETPSAELNASAAA
jgi:hypothetical protein